MMTEDVPNSRKDFSSTWLFEMPEGIGRFDLADMVVYNIKDMVKHGAVPEDLGNGLKKIDGRQTVFYWYEDSGKILLAAEFSRKPQALVVNAIGKFVKGKPPYASDLYSAVLHDQKKIAGDVGSIRLLSDNQLSDDGLAIWKKLVQLGHKVSVYDANAPGQTFTEIEKEDDLLKYFKNDDRGFRRWQYVISESLHYSETRALFNTRRLRELSGMSLD